jgi:hypothetical protein
MARDSRRGIPKMPKRGNKGYLGFVKSLLKSLLKNEPIVDIAIIEKLTIRRAS